MRTYIKNEIDKTWFVIEREEGEYNNNYQTAMILNNKITSILPLVIQRIDRKILLCYNISGMESVKDNFEHKKLCEREIRAVMEQITFLLREIKEYLLETGKIDLSPEHIFLRPGEGKLYFCYDPGLQTDANSAYTKFCEYILEKIDYQDRKGVELAYHFYQNAGTNRNTIHEILNYPSESFVPMRNMNGMEQEMNDACKTQPVEINKKGAKGKNTKDKTGKNDKEKESLGTSILNWFVKKSSDDTKKNKNDDMNQDLGMYYNAPVDEGYSFLNEPIADFTGIPEAIPQDNGFMRSESPISQDTQFITHFQNTAPIEVKMEDKSKWVLKSLTGEGTDFFLPKGIFIIGKKQDMVDGYIPKNTVSRVHCRIVMIGDKMYISDTNSTNGTYVNGKRLKYGESIEISSGDKLMFADVGYECYNTQDKKEEEIPLFTNMYKEKSENDFRQSCSL